jgi:PKD repeat protein
MDDKYDYHLVFETDGVTSHYEVLRVDPNKNGEIILTYTTASNTLNVETKNLKELTIDCKSVYFDESMDVFKEFSNIDYYKNYFKDLDKFTAIVKTDNKIDELRFKFMPEPVKVVVNSVEWLEDDKYEYEAETIILTDVPQGTTTVDVYFLPKIFPVPKFETDGTFDSGEITYAEIDTKISFDASTSTDSDGTITDFSWDFGDESGGTGKIAEHTYTTIGTYTVNLTITDNHDLSASTSKSITVVKLKDDLDDDGMSDIWEDRYGLDTTRNDANEDFDDDGLTNIQELENETLPNRDDTDGDNYNDLEELEKGSNPNDRTSTPKTTTGTGDGEGLDTFTILMIVAVIIIVLIIIVLALLIKKRKKKEEGEGEGAEGPELIEAGAEGTEGPAPEEPMEGEAGAVIPSQIGEEFMAPMPYPEEEQPYQPEGEEESMYKPEAEYPYSEVEEEVSLDEIDLGMEDLEDLAVTPEEGLAGAEEGLPPELEDKVLGKEPEEEIPADEVVPPEDEISEPEPLTKKPLKKKRGKKLPAKEAVPEPESAEEEPEPESADDATDEEEPEAEEPEEEPEAEPEAELTVRDYVIEGAKHFKNGDYTDAIIQWQKALDKEPDHPEIVASIKEAMAKLKEQ